MRVRFGDLLLDSDTRELRGGDESLHLSLRLQLLLALVESRPRALSKAQLRERLWPNTVVVEASLANLVGEIRAALRKDACHPRFVRTVQRFGYAFRLDPQPAAAPGHGKPATVYRLSWPGGRATLTQGEHIVGRDDDAAVRLDSTSVSRRHAAIRITETGVILEDLGSKNGTFIGERRLVSPLPLADGDEFRLGAVRIRLRIPKRPGSTETAEEPV
jgi:DNA-binding winged helix-turn-helix (wHTH) protein